MLDRHWFAAGLAGAAFGGALGLFRERDRIVRLLQRVVTAVLAVLAPVLGAGLLLFLLALPFTGLGALWQATRETTPILLSCAIGALILANAVIGNGEDEEAANPVLRWGAMALGLAILPLAVIAAIATGLRIGQYGFTPDRLWALVFVVLATAYGVAYLVSLVRGRWGWAARIRPANLHMAFIVAGMALILATPIPSFNAISTRDQVARLESGAVAPERFDWAALAFDFGDPGKTALKRLAASKNVAIADRARRAAAADNRYRVMEIDRTSKESAEPRQAPARAAGRWRGTRCPQGQACRLAGVRQQPWRHLHTALQDGRYRRFPGEGSLRRSSCRRTGNAGCLHRSSRRANPCVIRYRLAGTEWQNVGDGDACAARCGGARRASRRH